MKKERTYGVYFSSGHNKKEPKPVYRVRAKNKTDAYNLARKALEKEYIVSGSPYFFVEEISKNYQSHPIRFY